MNNDVACELETLRSALRDSRNKVVEEMQQKDLNNTMFAKGMATGLAVAAAMISYRLEGEE